MKLPTLPQSLGAADRSWETPPAWNPTYSCAVTVPLDGASVLSLATSGAIWAILGWSLAPRRGLSLTLTSFNRALLRGRPAPGLIFHSDRGVEFSGYPFRARLAALGITQTMKRPREIRFHRIFLPHPEGRCHPRPRLRQRARLARGDQPLHSSLQPHANPFRTGLPLAH